MRWMVLRAPASLTGVATLVLIGSGLAGCATVECWSQYTIASLGASAPNLTAGTWVLGRPIPGVGTETLDGDYQLGQLTCWAVANCDAPANVQINLSADSARPIVLEGGDRGLGD